VKVRALYFVDRCLIVAAAQKETEKLFALPATQHRVKLMLNCWTQND